MLSSEVDKRVLRHPHHVCTHVCDSTHRPVNISSRSRIQSAPRMTSTPPLRRSQRAGRALQDAHQMCIFGHPKRLVLQSIEDCFNKLLEHRLRHGEWISFADCLAKASGVNIATFMSHPMI